MTPKQAKAMRKGQLLMRRATPAMRAKWADKATKTRLIKRMAAERMAQLPVRVTGPDTDRMYRSFASKHFVDNNPFHEAYGLNSGEPLLIHTARGSTLRGRAVMPSPNGGWVINLGGVSAVETDEENTVRTRKKNPELMILSNPYCKTKKGKKKSHRRGRKGKKPVKIMLKLRKGAKLKHKGKKISLKSLINRLGKMGAGKYLKRTGKGSYRVKQIGYKKK